MTGRWSSRIALFGWIAAVAAIGAGLHWAGDGPLAAPALTEPGRWSAWLAERDPVLAAMAVLRLLALAGLWYLVAATAVGLVLRLVRAEGLVRVADRVTVTPVRRLVVAAVGLSFASGVAPAFAVAAPPARPTPAIVYQLPPGPGSPSTTTSTATTTTTTATATATTSPSGPAPPPTLTMRLLPSTDAEVPAEPTAAPAGPSATAVSPVAPQVGRATTWTVRPGECFWSIADDVLVRAWGRPVSDAEIVPYWRQLIEENRSRLGDRTNPDLIFPTQVFSVPAPPPPP